jgi:disulfide bond formation protein DsbB
MTNHKAGNVLLISWAQALIATMGSLYLSEILHYQPCKLCWYQRICMYPLVLIILVGILRNDKKLYLYVLPLSLTGLVIAAYHNLLYYGLLPNSQPFCELGVSCTTHYVIFFNLLSIPLLSLIAFAGITVCMLLYRKFAF